MNFTFETLEQLVDHRGDIASDGYVDDRNTDLADLERAWHHSLTKKMLAGSTAAAMARYHINNLGWPRIGYHVVIEPQNVIDTPNGPRARIVYCNNPYKESYHVGNSNDWAFGICVAGDYRTETLDEPTLASMAELHDALEQDNIGKGDRGHDEFPDYAWKACPEYDYMAAINYLDKNQETPLVGTNQQPVLREGDSGRKVEKLQETLKAAGEELPDYGADGDYGAETKAAVKSFQESAGIVVDGIAGPVTWNHLNEAIKADKNFKGKLAVVLHDGMNVRDKPSMDKSAIYGQVREGEAFTVIEKVTAAERDTELYLLKSGLYISAHEDYTELKDRPEEESADQLVIVRAKNVNVRDRASFDKDAIVGTVSEGEAFTIKDEHTVDGTPMFELKSGLFITGHKHYVEVK